jgi:hypothetical protein
MGGVDAGASGVAGSVEMLLLALQNGEKTLHHYEPY